MSEIPFTPASGHAQERPPKEPREPINWWRVLYRFLASIPWVVATLAVCGVLSWFWSSWESPCRMESWGADRCSFAHGSGRIISALLGSVGFVLALVGAAWWLEKEFPRHWAELKRRARVQP